MDAIEFQDWLKLIRAGDTNAVCRWADLYRPVVARAAFKLLAGSDLQRRIDCSDVAQEVLLRALKKLQSSYPVESDGQMKFLLGMMARNYIRDTWRGATQGAQDDKEVRINRYVPLQGDEVDSDLTPSTKASLKELYEQIRSKLAPDMQEVWDLRLACFSWDEIANKLGRVKHSLETEFRRRVNAAIGKTS
jgi:DNA-directed RNA polymerase specialized sigma24 family protein